MLILLLSLLISIINFQFIEYKFLSKRLQGTRSAIKKSNQKLLSHQLATNSLLKLHIRTITKSSSNTKSLIAPMADSTLLSKARKARFDDLPNFSGHPSEDVERFLKSIKNIIKATDKSEDHELLEIVRGKLVKSAGLWFDNNELKFKTWLDFETAFRTRYFSTMIVHTKFEKLKRFKKQTYLS